MLVEPVAELESPLIPDPQLRLVFPAEPEISDDQISLAAELEQ